MVIAMMCAVSASRGAVSQPCRKRYERPPKLLICPPTLPVSTPRSKKTFTNIRIHSGIAIMISVNIRRDNPLTSRFPRSASLNASSWCGIGWLRLSRLNQKNRENQVRFCPPILRVPNRLTRLWWGPMKVVLWMERPICARMRVTAMAIVRKCATKNRIAIQSAIPPRIANQMRNISTE